MTEEVGYSSTPAAQSAHIGQSWPSRPASKLIACVLLGFTVAYGHPAPSGLDTHLTRLPSLPFGSWGLLGAPLPLEAPMLPRV